MLFSDKNYNKTLILSILICILLIIFGLIYNIIYDLKSEEKVLKEISEDGIATIFNYKAYDGKNAVAIASRYIDKNSPELQKITNTSNNILNSKLSLHERYENFNILNKDIDNISLLLYNNESFNNSTKDKNLWEMLTIEVNNLSKSNVINTYNNAVSTYNSKLSSPIYSFFGKLFFSNNYERLLY